MQFDPRMAPRAGVKVATVICACRPLQLFEVFAPADGAFLLFADRPALHVQGQHTVGNGVGILGWLPFNVAVLVAFNPQGLILLRHQCRVGQQVRGSLHKIKPASRKKTDLGFCGKASR